MFLIKQVSSDLGITPQAIYKQKEELQSKGYMIKNSSNDWEITSDGYNYLKEKQINRFKRNNVSLKDLDRTLEGYEKLLSNPTMANMCESYGKYFDGSCESWSEQMQESNLKQCLDLIHQREPDVYEKIMERVSKGVVL